MVQFAGLEFSVARLSPDGKLIALGVGSDAIQLVDVATGKCCKKLKGACRGIAYLSFSPDSTLVVVGGAYGRIELWDIEKGVCLQRIEQEYASIDSVCFSPDGKLVAAVDGCKIILIRVHSLDSEERELALNNCRTVDHFAIQFLLEQKRFRKPVFIGDHPTLIKTIDSMHPSVKKLNLWKG